MRALTIAAAAVLLVPVVAIAGQGPSKPAADGKALFHEKCAMCHGPTGMGTGLLDRRVKPALLEERTDLNAEFVMQAARIGIGNMPAIPRGEASDAQLKAIADYLAAGPQGRSK